MALQNHYYRGREPWLRLSGGTMIAGTTVVLGRAPTADLEAATKLYADQAARPQGLNQQFQYNDSLVFNGSPNLLYDKIGSRVVIAPVDGATVQVAAGATTSVIFGNAGFPSGDFVFIQPLSGGLTYANIFSVRVSGGASNVLQVSRQSQVSASSLCAGELGGSG